MRQGDDPHLFTGTLWKGNADMKIFISYRRAEDDKTYLVGSIHEKLAEIFGKDNVFRDKNNISGGTDWRARLDHEVNTCKVMLAIIGPDWASLPDPNPSLKNRLFNEQDVTRWEVETGLRRRKDENIAFIPVLVTGARLPKKEDIPSTLHELHEIQAITLQNFPYFDTDMGKLIGDIRSLVGFREDDIKIKEEFEPKTIFIEQGFFWMGSPQGEGIPDFEMPQRQIEIPSYRIGKYPVTNKQYATFMRKTGRSALDIGWKSQKIPEGKSNQPVTQVSWFDALAYCRWLSEQTGREYSLPNEAQWEKACRGGNKTFFPWGEEFDPARCNQGQPELAAVDKYLEQNDYGCFDFVGNVRQWTSTLWGTDHAEPDQQYAYPWSDDGRNDLERARIVWRVVRGSSFSDDRALLRCSFKSGDSPESRGYPGAFYGFRVVMKEQ